MATLYELLMSRERGDIQNAPNTQQIGQAPLNLRSAMRYSAGGLTDQEINSYVQQNISNPAAIAEAAKRYGVTAEDLSRSTGYTPEQVKTYFASAGIGNLYGGIEPSQIPMPQMPPMAPSPYTYDAPEPTQEPIPPMPRGYIEEVVPSMPPMPPKSPTPIEYLELPPLQKSNQDPGFSPAPINPSYPPGYFDPNPVADPAGKGIALTPPEMTKRPEKTLPYGGGSGYSGRSTTGESMSGLGGGLPGQSTQGQAGSGQSLDSLIEYLTSRRRTPL